MRLTPPKRKTDMSGLFANGSQINLLAEGFRWVFLGPATDGCGGRNRGLKLGCRVSKSRGTG